QAPIRSATPRMSNATTRRIGAPPVRSVRVQVIRVCCAPPHPCGGSATTVAVRGSGTGSLQLRLGRLSMGADAFLATAPRPDAPAQSQRPPRLVRAGAAVLALG